MSQSIQSFKNFAQKLSSIVQDYSISNIIFKDPRDSFIYILNQQRLVEEVLPQFFRHSNIQSFFRQLHLYGFKKIRNMEHHTFFHPKLKQGARIQQLISIKKAKKIDLKQQKALRRKLALQKRMENKALKNQTGSQSNKIEIYQTQKVQKNLDNAIIQEEAIQEQKIQRIYYYDNQYSEYDQNVAFYFWNYVNYCHINNMNIWI